MITHLTCLALHTLAPHPDEMKEGKKKNSARSRVIQPYTVRYDGTILSVVSQSHSHHTVRSSTVVHQVAIPEQPTITRVSKPQDTNSGNITRNNHPPSTTVTVTYQQNDDAFFFQQTQNPKIPSLLQHAYLV